MRVLRGKLLGSSVGNTHHNVGRHNEYVKDACVQIEV